MVSVSLPESKPIFQSGLWETGEGRVLSPRAVESARASGDTIIEGAVKGAEKRFSNLAPPR